MNPTAEVRALGRDPSIRITGEVPDVRPYLWESAVSIAPIAVARGVQNKVLEAIAAGLPCVVTPAVYEGLPDTIHPACTEAKDPRAFANAIVARLRETPQARRGRAETADLSSLTWSAQLRPLVDLLVATGRKARK
jgi:glycosyltransferase involved in cell wall biosynthesis